MRAQDTRDFCFRVAMLVHTLDQKNGDKPGIFGTIPCSTQREVSVSITG